MKLEFEIRVAKTRKMKIHDSDEDCEFVSHNQAHAMPVKYGYREGVGNELIYQETDAIDPSKLKLTLMVSRTYHFLFVRSQTIN